MEPGAPDPGSARPRLGDLLDPSRIALDTGEAYRLKLAFQEFWDLPPELARLHLETVVPARRRERPSAEGNRSPDHPQTLPPWGPKWGRNLRSTPLFDLRKVR